MILSRRANNNPESFFEGLMQKYGNDLDGKDWNKMKSNKNQKKKSCKRGKKC